MRAKKNQRGAFTLVELLLVVLIIGMLAAILLPVVLSALKRAEMARAKSEMVSLVSAINAYVNEYGVMPAGRDNGRDDGVYVGKWGSGMEMDINPKKANYIYNILRAIDTTNNPKRIVFLEIPEESMRGTCSLQGVEDKDKGYQPADGYFLDPWGNPYVIVMDTSFDGKLGGKDGLNDTKFLLYGSLVSYIRDISPTKAGTFPGVKAGVMSWGPKPGDTNSFMMSWEEGRRNE